MSLLRAVPCLAALGCGTLLEVQITVVVPVEVQERYTKDAPGRVVLQIEHEDLDRIVALGVICNPKDRAVDFGHEATGIGCASSGTARAWVEPADKGAPCGPNDEWLDEPSPAKDHDAVAQAPIMKGVSECDAVGEPVMVTLVP